MKQKIVSVMICLCLLGSLFLSASAAQWDDQILDFADILNKDDQQALEMEADALKDTYGMEILILTVDSLDGNSAQHFADDFYDGNGYGDNGVLFLLAMAEREWYISTCGDAIYALTDYGIQQLGDAALPYLSSGDYFEAFHAYLDALPFYLDAYEDGSPIDGYADYSGDYYHGDRDDVVYYEDQSRFGVGSVMISLIIGFVAALVTVWIMRASMNTKRPQNSAGDYVKPGSYDLYRRHDMFLYSQVSKVRRQQNNGGGHGGGSSIHRSSGGRSHGGGGGRF